MYPKTALLVLGTVATAVFAAENEHEKRQGTPITVGGVSIPGSIPTGIPDSLISEVEGIFTLLPASLIPSLVSDFQSVASVAKTIDPNSIEAYVTSVLASIVSDLPPDVQSSIANIESSAIAAESSLLGEISTAATGASASITTAASTGSSSGTITSAPTQNTAATTIAGNTGTTTVAVGSDATGSNLGAVGFSMMGLAAFLAAAAAL